jgi:hypothetical protein
MVEEGWKYKLILLNDQIEKGNFGVADAVANQAQTDPLPFE